MPEMDEGALVIDYHMPVGTSLAQTDKVLRRVEAILLETPDISGYIRRTGAELGLFATESYTGDILVSLKPPAEQRRAWTKFSTPCEKTLKQAVPELEIEIMPLVQDQIDDLAGVDSPIEVKVFGPDPAVLAGLAERSRQDRRRSAGSGGREHACVPWAIPTSSSGLTACRRPAWA